MSALCEPPLRITLRNSGTSLNQSQICENRADVSSLFGGVRHSGELQNPTSRFEKAGIFRLVEGNNVFSDCISSPLVLQTLSDMMDDGSRSVDISLNE